MAIRINNSRVYLISQIVPRGTSDFYKYLSFVLGQRRRVVGNWIQVMMKIRLLLTGRRDEVDWREYLDGILQVGNGNGAEKDFPVWGGAKLLVLELSFDWMVWLVNTHVLVWWGGALDCGIVRHTSEIGRFSIQFNQ